MCKIYSGSSGYTVAGRVDNGKVFFEKNKSNILTIGFLWKLFEEIYNTNITTVDSDNI